LRRMKQTLEDSLRKGLERGCAMHLCTETGASTVWAAIMGPMVDPHGQSLRTTNSWQPMLALRESSRITKPVVTCRHRRVRGGGEGRDVSAQYGGLSS
jgi:hypothetical protein